VLVQWDQVNEEARTCGQLHVAAWGANTVRTEFAFLSGMTPGDLGVHRFNPYRKLARSGINTVATLLKKQGYRTICVHPYLASFYSRNEVFPLLGFDEFIDIESFEAADKVGPYIGDVSVADKVIEQLKGASQPTFIFAITMENHGPLHWEKVGTDEANTLFEKMPPAECDDLVVFARHLRNADAMLGKLTQYLRTSASPAWVCMYGDHVPIMPKVYQALGTPSGTTDYCIWGNAASGAHIKARSRADMNVSDLASLLLRCAAEEELIS
jgi:phosphoglycerol transferase MdoB-like AlkP superfamily enzyme